LRHIVITGAGGFLGRHLAAMANSSGVQTVTLIGSPRAPQGVDLAGNHAIRALQQKFPIPDPEETAVIHAAAFVQWDSADAVIQNSMMAFNVASWIAQLKIPVAVLVSGVNAGIEDPPQTMYGVGKLAAEHIWRVLLRDRHATVRLAGIWGWQRNPSLFWNRVLTAAARNENQPLHVCKKYSRRNYIHAEDASRLLLALAENRGLGSFIAAGRDALSTQEFVEAVQRLPGARLTVNYSEDHCGEDQIYPCSPELLPYIRPFPEALAETWRSKPEWTTQ
jgi:nucleoside-diphosphate-sugar epimerase